MLENDVWTLIPKPDHINQNDLMETKWVTCHKYVPDSPILKKKARLVVKGFKQVEGRDFDQVYAPTLDNESLKLLLTIATTFKFHISSADVTTAYLNSKIDKKLYIKQPIGKVVKGKEDWVLELNKGIYGLKQGGYLWFKHIVSILKSLGFRQLSSNQNIFVNNNKTIFIGLYVDDMIIVSKNLIIAEQFISDLINKGKLKVKHTKNTEKCLGIQFNIKNDQIRIFQKEKIIELATQFNIKNKNNQRLPMMTNNLIDDFDDNDDLFEDINLFQSLIGKVLYIARMTRPDIQFAVNQLAKYNTRPRISHFNYGIQIIQYLFNTQNYCLTYSFSDSKKANFEIEAFTDSDFANSIVDRKSYSGYIIFVNNCPISWSSTKQNLVALSSNEAEIIAANETLRTILFIKNMIIELFELVSLKAYLNTDNRGVILFAERGINQRTKHLDIRLKHLFDCSQRNEIELCKVKSKYNVADIFTKFLKIGIFKFLFPKLKLEDCE